MAQDSVLRRIPRRRDNQYETYILNFSLPAVRLHERGASRRGDWFAVDEYNLSIAAYRRRYAALKKWNQPGMEIFTLPSGTIVNAGTVGSQKSGRRAFYPGGAMQFEVLEGGARPQHLEHNSSPDGVRF